jgi:hypothetical protein
MTETPDPKRKREAEPPGQAAGDEPPADPQKPADAPYSADEEAEVAARLESLGYM